LVSVVYWKERLVVSVMSGLVIIWSRLVDVGCFGELEGEMWIGLFLLFELIWYVVAT